tara:strand:- start:322 stop:660 length:339 start_codon:yes stop_codon:yes gene_type:complete
MAAIRQEKVAELIRRDLSVLFQQNSSSWFAGMFISVTQVRMSPDLGLAKVYLSFMAVPDKKIALEAVKQEAWRVRKALSDKIGKQVRVIPELNFYLDVSIDYYESINNALKK